MIFRTMRFENATGGAGAGGGGGGGTPTAAPEFKVETAVAFLGEHGVDPKSLEGVAEADLRTRYESARTIAEKATAKALEAAKAGAPKAPEKYELKAPEGVELDPAVAQEFEGYARELGLPQDKAQKGFELGAKIAQSVIAKQTADLAALRKGWQEAVKSDKEFGGPKLQESLGHAEKSKQAFLTPELRDVLDKSGLGDHPELVRMWVRVGKLMAEDKIVSGGAAPDRGDMADRLYGKKAA